MPQLKTIGKTFGIRLNGAMIRVAPQANLGTICPPDLARGKKVQLGPVGGLVLIGKAVDLKSTGGNPLQVRVLHPPPIF